MKRAVFMTFAHPLASDYLPSISSPNNSRTLSGKLRSIRVRGSSLYRGNVDGILGALYAEEYAPIAYAPAQSCIAFEIFDIAGKRGPLPSRPGRYAGAPGREVGFA
jgi:hypothetical protein